MAEQRGVSPPPLLSRAAPRLRVVLLVLLAAALWAAFPLVGRHLDFFRVRRLEFVGMSHLEPARAMAALALAPGASVLDDARPLEQRLLAIRGVRTVAVAWRLPGTLVVELQEWAAVALVPQHGALALMDETGRFLPFDPAVTAPDLPVAARADAALGHVLASVRAFDPALFARVGTAWRAGLDVVLEVDGRRLWFGPAATAEDIRAVTAVAQDLARRGRGYQELDGRFAGQVIVRGARA